MHVGLTDREGIPSVEADAVDVAVEERLGAGLQLLADPSDAEDVRGAVSENGRVGDVEEVIPVILPPLRVDGFIAHIETLASRRGRFEHPARIQDVAVVELHVAAAEVIRGTHREGANEIGGQRRCFGREPLLACDVLVIPLVGEVEVGLVPHDRSPDAEAHLERPLIGLVCVVGQKVPPGVEGVVTEVRVQPTVKLVGAASRDHVDDRARAAAVLGAVLVRQHLILVDVVEHHAHLGALAAAQPVVVVVHAVDQVHVRLRRRAVRNHLTALER